MSIEERLRTALTAAIRAKDLRTANVIRMISTKVMEKRTAKNFDGEVDDALYEEVIGAYRKSLQKAVTQFEDIGDSGAEQAAELKFEIEYCAQYLPKGLGEDEIRAAVKEAIAALGADNPKMAGRVMGQVMKAHKGKVDSADVKRIVGEELGS
jgi:uncharacterized protein YqeY